MEIRKLQDTSVFRTDLWQVFDFIRCAEDKAALKALVGQDDYYKNMEEDAFDVVSHYTNTAGLIEMKKYYRKDGKVNMCKALEDWIEEERAEGLKEGRAKGIEEGRLEGVKKGWEEGKIEGVILMCREFALSDDATVKKLQKMFFLSKREAKQYLKKSQNN
ncbi:MAG: hypothetical protein NC407_12725 [Lachnoclostridium sp.]|nr:hypothetical protein [Lachnoclostridium sp.]